MGIAKNRAAILIGFGFAIHFAFSNSAEAANELFMTGREFEMSEGGWGGEGAEYAI